MNDLNDDAAAAAVAAAHEQADKQQLDRPRIKKYHKTIFNMFQIAQLFSHTNVVAAAAAACIHLCSSS